MRAVPFPSCVVVVNYREGFVITIYEDGSQIKSQSFHDTTASEFGYDPADGKRLSCDHDLLHHWLGQRLGSGSLNHWIISHHGDNDSSRKLREREERLVTGVMMLMRPRRVPMINSWHTVPNEASYYMDFAIEVLGPQAADIVEEGKLYLDSLYSQEMSGVAV